MEYNECKSGNKRGTIGGGESGYGYFLREGEVGVGGGACTCVAVVSGISVDTGGCGTGGGRRSGGMGSGGVGERHCSRLSEVFGELWQKRLPRSFKFHFFSSVFSCSA